MNKMLITPVCFTYSYPVHHNIIHLIILAGNPHSTSRYYGGWTGS